MDPDEIILWILQVLEHKKGYNQKLLDDFEDLKDKKLIIAGGLNNKAVSELEILV